MRARYRSPSVLARCRARASEGLRPWEERALSFHRADAGRVGPRGRWLDLGCGAGREALALSRRGRSAVGLDPLAEQLTLARGVLGDAVPLVRSGGPGLPFRTGAFSHVLLWSQVLGNVPGDAARLALLRECRRVLTGGGRLSLSVHDRDRTEAAGRGLLLPAPPELEDGDFLMDDAPDSGTPCYWHYFRRAEIEDLCGRAGLVVVACASASAFGDPARDNLWICLCEHGPDEATPTG